MLLLCTSMGPEIASNYEQKYAVITMATNKPKLFTQQQVSSDLTAQSKSVRKLNTGKFTSRHSVIILFYR